MEFLRQSRGRTFLSEALHVLLNVLMAVAIFVVVYFVGSLYAAFGLIALSKWRVFAVRPRHWFAHLVSNMVDIIVGLSFVVLLVAATGSLVLQLILTALYIAWLLVLKPQSKQYYVVLQAGVGLVLGVAALMHIAYDWWASAVVVVMWIIGYSTARHALGAYKEPHTGILSLVWGLVVAEVGWIVHHWTMAYSLGFSTDFMLPQAAIIVGLLGFIAERCYASVHKHSTLRMNDIGLPLLFSISLIILVVTVFGSVSNA